MMDDGRRMIGEEKRHELTGVAEAFFFFSFFFVCGGGGAAFRFRPSATDADVLVPNAGGAVCVRERSFAGSGERERAKGIQHADGCRALYADIGERDGRKCDP